MNLFDLLDLQLFAEEVESEESSAEESGQEQAEEIPAELQGVDEDIAREIMQEAAQMAQPEKQEQAEESTADADSDTKTVEDSVIDTPQKAIPYSRFKEVNDKAKQSATEAAQLKQQLAELQAQMQQRQAQPQSVAPAAPPVQQQQQVVQQPQITAEPISKVNAIAYQEALKMSGMTKEDVDSLQYDEDGNTKVQLWQSALEAAKARTWNAVDTEFRAKQAQAAQTLQLHQQVVNEYSSFEQEQMKAPDFAATRDYAINTYFSTLSPLEQQTVTAAYQRVDRNVCSPQDVFVVKNYYKEAAAAYRAVNPVNENPTNTNQLEQKKQKIKEMERHPRAGQVSGSSSSGSAVTPEALERMLNEKDWDEIPADIQKLLLSGGN